MLSLIRGVFFSILLCVVSEELAQLLALDFQPAAAFSRCPLKVCPSATQPQVVLRMYASSRPVRLAESSSDDRTSFESAQSKTSQHQAVAAIFEGTMGLGSKSSNSSAVATTQSITEAVADVAAATKRMAASGSRDDAGRRRKGDRDSSASSLTTPAQNDDASPRLWVRFEIQDTGQGMSADAVQSLFQPFNQVRKSL